MLENASVLLLYKDKLLEQKLEYPTCLKFFVGFSYCYFS